MSGCSKRSYLGNLKQLSLLYMEKRNEKKKMNLYIHVEKEDISGGLSLYLMKWMDSIYIW
jgi:hypothetical protein